MSVGDFATGLKRAVQSAVCQALNSPLIDGRQWGPNPPFTGTSVADNPLSRFWYSSTLDAAKYLLCNIPERTPEEDLFPPPFEGGQCPVQYRVRTQATFNFEGFSSTLVSGEFIVDGPISGVSVQSGNFPECGLGSAQAVVLGTASGSVVTQCRGQAVSISGAGIASLVRVDGLPDECGDRPGPYEPTNIYVLVDQSITYIDNSNNEQTILGDFNLFAPIFLPGSVTFPFTVDVGGLTLNGTLDLNGEFNFSPSLELTVGTEENPEVGPEFDPSEQPDPTEEPPDIEQFSTIVGCWANLVDMGRRTTKVSQNGEVSYYPRWGILKFVVLTEDGLALSEGTDLKTDRVYVPAPPSGNVIGARFIPYYGSRCTFQLAFTTRPVGPD